MGIILCFMYLALFIFIVQRKVCPVPVYAAARSSSTSHRDYLQSLQSSAICD